jgi:uncharacterized Zn-finger protein
LEKKFICDFKGCKRGFTHPTELKHHKKRHSNIREYTCKICGASYFKPLVLRYHIQSIHLGISFKCEAPGCKSEFKRKESLKRHVINTHQDIGEENLQQLIKKITDLKNIAADST